MTRPGAILPTLKTKWPLALGVAAVVAVVVPALWHGPTLLLWNATASVPIGLYIVQPTHQFQAGDLAVVTLPDAPRHFAAQRRYLPSDVLLIKPVAAVSGSRVCRRGTMIFVNDGWIGNALSADRLHRSLPVWQGCRVLSQDQLFLMNPQVNDSFDGRYFGPITRRLSRGRAWPVLTFPVQSPL